MSAYFGLEVGALVFPSQDVALLEWSNRPGENAYPLVSSQGSLEDPRVLQLRTIKVGKFQNRIFGLAIVVGN